MKKTYLVLAVCGDDEYLKAKHKHKGNAIKEAKRLHEIDTHNGERFTDYIVREEDTYNVVFGIYKVE